MIADPMQLSTAEEQEIEEMKQRVAPQAVLDAIEESQIENGSNRTHDARSGNSVDQSAVQGDGAAGRRGGGAGAFGEVLRELGMPSPRGFGHRTLRRHPLFDRSAPVVTLVRFHLSLRSETERPSPATC